MAIQAVATIVSYLLQLMMFAIIVRALLSWFMPTQSNAIIRFLVELTEPILAPLRRFTTFGAIDLSPLVALLLLQLLQQWLTSVL